MMRYHATDTNLKDKQREWLAAKVQAYLDAGGKIEKKDSSANAGGKAGGKETFNHTNPNPKKLKNKGELCILNASQSEN